VRDKKKPDCFFLKTVRLLRLLKTNAYKIEIKSELGEVEQIKSFKSQYLSINQQLFYKSMSVYIKKKHQKNYATDLKKMSFK
jgi:hypothetical protein